MLISTSPAEANDLVEQITNILMEGQRSLVSFALMLPSYVRQRFAAELRGVVSYKDLGITLEWDLRAPYDHSSYPIILRIWRLNRTFAFPYEDTLNHPGKLMSLIYLRPDDNMELLTTYDVEVGELINSVKQGVKDCRTAAEDKVRDILKKFYGDIVIDFYDKMLDLHHKLN